VRWFERGGGWDGLLFELVLKANLETVDIVDREGPRLGVTNGEPF
jgi:hypothetical protein